MVARPFDAAAPRTGSASAGLGRVLLGAGKSWLKHRCPAAAAGAAFYLVLAFFPGVAAFGSALGLLGQPEGIERKLTPLAGLVPADVFHMIVGEAPRFSHGERTRLLGAALLFAALCVASASSAVRQLMVSLNTAYRSEETRHWAVRRALAVLFATGVAVGATAEVGLLIKTAELRVTPGGPGETAEVVGKWLSAFALSVVALQLLYRYAPDRRRVRWRWVTPGSVAASLLGIACSVAVSLYLGRVAHYQRTYGGLGALLGLAVWMWSAMGVVLAGAELNDALERRTRGEPLDGGVRT